MSVYYGVCVLLFNENNMIHTSPAKGRDAVLLRGSGCFLLFLNLYWMIGAGLILSGCSQKESSDAAIQNEIAVDKTAKSLQPARETKKNESLQQKEMPADFTKNKKSKTAKNTSRTKLQPETVLNRQHLRALGFDIFESRNLLLVSDAVQAEKQDLFEKLPDIVDQLTKRFCSDYPQTPDQVQLTGYVMRDRSLYLQAKLLSDDFANIEHGANRGRAFWMNEQKTDYYRRHLLIHEAVHCLMDLKPHRWPVWYLEGMAEYYAIHQMGPDQNIQFGIAPAASQIEGGFGRLQLIRDEIRAGQFRTITQIRQLNVNNFYPHKTSYAWSWALCYFLATHPETHQKFLQLERYRDLQHFNQFFDQVFPAEDAKLNAQWAVFVSSLVAGYDIKRGSISWNHTDKNERKQSVIIQVDRSWQSSNIQVFKGKEYRIKASGHFSVAQKPIPWECEPEGVSIDYVDGQPLGQLQAVLFHPDQPGKDNDSGFLHLIPVSRQLNFKPKQNGELFFRINDRGSSWGDNKGTVTISVKETVSSS